MDTKIIRVGFEVYFRAIPSDWYLKTRTDATTTACTDHCKKDSGSTTGMHCCRDGPVGPHFTPDTYTKVVFQETYQTHAPTQPTQPTRTAGQPWGHPFLIQNMSQENITVVIIELSFRFLEKTTFKALTRMARYALSLCVAASLLLAASAFVPQTPTLANLRRQTACSASMSAGENSVSRRAALFSIPAVFLAASKVTLI